MRGFRIPSLWLCVLVGCANAADGGAGYGASGAGGVGGFGGGGGSAPAQLRIESRAMLTLAPSESAEIRMRYLSASGQPVADALLGFTLVGRAQDSGLTELMVKTGADGRASTSLIAGLQSTTFQVRVSAPNVAPVSIDVAVSDRGFGTLRVNVPYQGSRLVTERRVSVFAETTCAEVADAPAASRQSTLTPGGDETRLIGMPAAPGYAVLAEALSGSAVVMARGCVDGVEIVADAESTVDVTLEDLQLQPAGDYALSVIVVATGAIASMGDVVRAHVLSGSESGIAARWLDALDETLRADSNAVDRLAAADALGVLRQGNAADVEVQAALDAQMLGPDAAQQWLADELGASFHELKLSATLAVGAEAPNPAVSLLLQGASAHGSGDYADVTYTLAAPVSAAAEASCDWGSGSMTMNATVASPIGALTVEIVDVLVDAADAQGAAQVDSLLGCEVVGAWVAAQPALVSACDGECVAQTCSRVRSAWLSSLQATLVAVDVARPEARLQGDLIWRDTTGDLVVDDMSGEDWILTWAADPAQASQADFVAAPTLIVIRAQPTNP